MSNMKRWNYIISVVMFAFALGVIFLSRSLHTPSKTGDPGADIWPLMLAGVLIFLACLLTVLTTVNSKKESQKTFALLSRANIQVYIFMGLTVLFCVLMYVFGIIIAALVFIPAAMRMLGIKSLKQMLIVDFIIVLSIYIIFQLLLKTPLPAPIFMR